MSNEKKPSLRFRPGDDRVMGYFFGIILLAALIVVVVANGIEWFSPSGDPSPITPESDSVD